MYTLRKNCTYSLCNLFIQVIYTKQYLWWWEYFVWCYSCYICK